MYKYFALRPNKHPFLYAARCLVLVVVYFPKHSFTVDACLRLAGAFPKILILLAEMHGLYSILTQGYLYLLFAAAVSSDLHGHFFPFTLTCLEVCVRRFTTRCRHSSIVNMLPALTRSRNYI